MLTKIYIEQVVQSQAERLKKKSLGLHRTITGFENLSSHAFIITGIRRCGKSTLLQQINNLTKAPCIYLNFEDPRLAGFDLSDFNRLHQLALASQSNTYFFDEIQLIPNWESFVRFRLDEGYNVFITGSNATLLSKELGTKLTGRHISKELFPFSYSEYLLFTNDKPNEVTSEQYLTSGGFPEYLKTYLPDILMQSFNDIIVRDIAVRFQIKNTPLLQQLAVWLASNCGKPFTGNSLRKLFQIASSSTIMEYLTYFTDAYLFFYIPRFSYSLKVQIVNPKKIYCVDNGFISINSASFNPDKGRLLENMVFLQLRYTTNEIYYYSEKGECDFVVFQNKKLMGLYQVCWQLDEENLNRELSGLTEAMDFFGLQKGFIITHCQTDTFFVDNKTIEALPFYNWALAI